MQAAEQGLAPPLEDIGDAEEAVLVLVKALSSYSAAKRLLLNFAPAWLSGL